MPDPEPAETPAAQSRFAEEIKNMEYEPLLDIEKRLITWSLILGVVLIGVLVWVSHTFFEV